MRYSTVVMLPLFYTKLLRVILEVRLILCEYPLNLIVKEISSLIKPETLSGYDKIGELLLSSSHLFGRDVTLVGFGRLVASASLAALAVALAAALFLFCSPLEFLLRGTIQQELKRNLRFFVGNSKWNQDRL